MEDKDYLAALRQAYDAGRLRAELDFGKLDHVDSPIVVQAEKARWVYGGMFGALAIGWFVGWPYGVGFAAAAAVAYATVGRRLMNRRMAARFRSLALENIGEWRRLWKLKGVTLVIGEQRCESPDGNWMRFVMTNLPPPA